MARQLIQQGDSVRLREMLRYGRVPLEDSMLLHEAVVRGNVACTQVLLDHGGISVAKQVDAMHVATRRCDHACLAALLSHPDANPNAASSTDSNNNTPLCTAVHAGSVKCVQALLEHPDINPNKGRHGSTPLHEALQHGTDPGILKAILWHARTCPNLSNSEGYAPLHVAVLLALCGEVQELLSHPDIDPSREVFDGSGSTPLHLALSMYDLGNTACVNVKALLAHPRANPDKLNAEGKSPLHTAIEHYCMEPLPMLLNHAGIDVNRPCVMYKAWGNGMLRTPLQNVIIRLWHYAERAACWKFVRPDYESDAEGLQAMNRAMFNTLLRHERVDITGTRDFAAEKEQALQGRQLSNAFEETAAAVGEEEAKRKRWCRRVHWVRCIVALK